MKKIVAAILILCLLLTAGLGLGPYLLRIDKIRDQIVGRLSSELATSITIGAIEWRWLPLPCLALLDVRAENRQFNVQLPEAILYPSFFSRLGLGFALNKVLLSRPRVTMKSWEQAGASQELVPASLPRVVIQDGLFTVERQVELPGISLAAGLALALGRAELDFAAGGLDFTMAGKASCCESFRLSGSLRPDTRQYDLDFSLQGLALHQGFASLLAGRLEPTEGPAVSLAGHLAGKWLATIEARLKGGVPDFQLRRAEQQLAIKGGVIDLEFAKGQTDEFSLRIKELAAAEPGCRLHGVISRQAAASARQSPAWHIDLAGEQLDLTAIRAGVLSLLGEHPVAIKVCDIVLAGRARAATYRFDGPAEDLRHLKNMTITAEAEDATIHVPKAELELVAASGPITIKDAILTGSGLRATLGESRGENGSIFLGLTHEDRRFSLDLDIEANLAELPPVLHQLIHHAGFNQELARFSKVEGRGRGHLTIGDCLDHLVTTVSVADAGARCSYDRIPWPMAINHGWLRVQHGEVEWRGAGAVVGPHLIKNSAGRVMWAEGEINLEIKGLEAALDAGALYPELAARGLLPAKIQDNLNVSRGMLDITSATLTGPATVPRDWQYRIAAGMRELNWSSPRLPEPALITSGALSIDNHELTLANCTVLLLGQPISAAGRLSHQLLADWQGRLQLAGMVNEPIGQWVRGLKLLPEAWFPRIPCTVRELAIEWGGGEAVRVHGEVSAGAGQATDASLAVALEASAERLLIKELTLSSPDGEQARLALERSRQPPNETSWQWQGVVSAPTLGALFAENFIRAGSLSGDWQMSLADDPQLSSFNGTLAAEGLRWQWGPEETARLNARIQGQGRTLTIEKLALDAGSGPLELHGTLSPSGSAMAADMTLAAPDMSRQQMQRLLAEFKRQAEKATWPGVRPKWQTGPFAWDITGRINFRIGSYSTTFKPPASPADKQPSVYIFNHLDGTINYQAGDARTIRVEHAELCGMNASATLHAGEPAAQNSFELATPAGASLLFQDVLPCLGSKQELLEGAFTLAGALQGRPEQWSGGRLEVHSTKGRILRLKLLSTILSVVNVTDLFTSDELSDMDKEGFGYSELELLGQVQDNRLEISQGIVRGEGLNLFGHGSMDLQNLECDFIILVAPLKTIDTIIGNIPLIGQAVGGKYTALISIPVGVTGSIKEPQATVLAPEAVGKSVLEFFKSVVKLPFRLFNPLLPEESPADQPPDGPDNDGETPAP